MNEREAIKSAGGEVVKSYSLVNNYGYIVKVNGRDYDIRHTVNVYGAEANIWEATPNDGSAEVEAIIEALKSAKSY